MQSLLEKELIGKSDAEDYSGIPWYFCGLLLGFFAVPFVYLKKVNQTGINYGSLTNDQERQVYLKGYQSAAKNKRITAVVLGWLTWVVVTFVYMMYIPIY